MDKIRLAILNYAGTTKDYSLIHEVLVKAISLLDGGWVLSEPADTDLMLVWVNAEADIKILQHLDGKYPPENIIVLVSNEYSVSARWQLSYPKQKNLPSILAVTKLLSRVQAHFSPVSRFETRGNFDPNQYFYGLLQKAMADGVARICSYPGCPDVYLLPKENSFYLSGEMEKLIPMMLVDWQDLTVTSVNDQQIIEKVSYVQFSARLSQYMFLEEDSIFQTLNVNKYKRYSLNELVWFCILIVSRGRLLPNMQATDVVLLKQMPEYLRLDYYAREYKPLANCFCGDALSLYEASAITQFSLYEIIGFINACKALELVERGEAALKIVQSKKSVRSDLESNYASVGSALKGRIKIVIAGSVGSGKTAAIAAISDFSPISTETRPSDSVTRKKSTTTVAMDYGEIRFRNDLKIFLYGTPGQKRFDFMGQILCENAWGMLLLIDNSENEPFTEIDYYLDLYARFLPKLKLVIGITHLDICKSPSLDDYADYLAERGLYFPIVQVDARDNASIANALSSLTQPIYPMRAVPLKSVG